jgi:hypothetical protein
MCFGLAMTKMKNIYTIRLLAQRTYDCPVALMASWPPIVPFFTSEGQAPSTTHHGDEATYIQLFAEDHERRNQQEHNTIVSLRHVTTADSRLVHDDQDDVSKSGAQQRVEIVLCQCENIHVNGEMTEMSINNAKTL